jgi:hypothetical protein
MNPTTRQAGKKFWGATTFAGHNHRAKHERSNPIPRCGNKTLITINLSAKKNALKNPPTFLFRVLYQAYFSVGLSSPVKHFGISEPDIALKLATGQNLGPYVVVNRQPLHERGSGKGLSIGHSLVVEHASSHKTQDVMVSLLSKLNCPRVAHGERIESYKAKTEMSIGVETSQVGKLMCFKLYAYAIALCTCFWDFDGIIHFR